MKAEMYTLHEAHEQTHWWFAARRRIVLHLIRRELAMQNRTEPLRVLDVGCGAGAMLSYLQEFGSVCGVDPSPLAVEYAAGKGTAPVLRGGLPRDLPFSRGERFDLITLLDVLEHVEEDEQSLAALRTLLHPGGSLVITVPAYQFLWSSHDVVNEHCRRYTRTQLAALLQSAGFHVRTISYYNTFLFPPVAAVRMARRAFSGTAGDGDLGVVPRPLNVLLREVFALERHLVGRIPLPAGVSLIALARY